MGKTRRRFFLKKEKQFVFKVRENGYFWELMNFTTK